MKSINNSAKSYKNIMYTAFGNISVAIHKVFLYREFVGFEVCLRKQTSADTYDIIDRISVNDIVTADAIQRNIVDQIFNIVPSTNRYVVHGKIFGCHKIATYGVCNVNRVRMNHETIYEVCVNDRVLMQFSQPLDAFRYASLKGEALEKEILKKVEFAWKG